MGARDEAKYLVVRHWDIKRCPEVAGGMWRVCRGHIESSQEGLSLADAKAEIANPKRAQWECSICRGVHGTEVEHPCE